jgi:glutathione-regulated potassium-efflux system ancillary protein KefF
MICVVLAHPYPSRSRANRALAEVLAPLPGIELRSLYALYPDFDIDAGAEQAALAAARLLVWMHPLWWYGAPALLKHWFDQVLTAGWAYGEGGDALRGKACLWVATTGGDASAYAPGGLHGRPFLDFAAPFEQTARFCGMDWQAPFVLHNAGALTPAELEAAAGRLRQRLAPWLPLAGAAR